MTLLDRLDRCGLAFADAATAAAAISAAADELHKDRPLWTKLGNLRALVAVEAAALLKLEAQLNTLRPAILRATLDERWGPPAGARVEVDPLSQEEADAVDAKLEELRTGGAAGDVLDAGDVDAAIELLDEQGLDELRTEARRVVDRAERDRAARAVREQEATEAARAAKPSEDPRSTKGRGPA